MANNTALLADQLFDLSAIHPSWLPCVQRGLASMDAAYLSHLSQNTAWLPGPEKIFNAFTLPLDKVNYVLFGESPYPRRASANGYAFWDAAVGDIWSSSGLSKQVNRATSLRNIIKMLLVAEGALDPQMTSQEAIASLNKTSFIQTNDEFFNHLLTQGFLLLNATPVLKDNGAPQKDARAWLPFMRELLICLLEQRPQVRFILLGRIASTIDELIPGHQQHNLYAEHPYNISFITNPEVLDFFRPLHLLKLFKCR
jgi:uracil-DNA glycosylase